MILSQTKRISFLDGPDRVEVSNRIHSTTGAKEFGYERALVGGVTVYSWTVSDILKALGNEWLENGWAHITFRRPTFPNDQVTSTVTSWGEETFVTLQNSSLQCCLIGNVGLGKAPWLSDLHVPSLKILDSSNYPKGNIPIGRDLLPKQIEISEEKAKHYASKFPRDNSELWNSEKSPLIHPGWIAAQMTPFIEYSLRHLPAIHAETKVQHLAKLRAGQKFVLFGHLTDYYERNENHYAVVDGALVNSSGEIVAQLRHSTIFQMRKSRPNL